MLLENICEVYSGYALKEFHDVKEGSPVIKIGNILTDGSLDLNNCHYTSEIVNEKYYSKYGDIYIALSGATTGKVGILKSSDRFVINQRVGIVREKENHVPIEFIKFFLLKQTNRILKEAAGCAQPNISPKQIAKYVVPEFDEEEMLHVTKILNKLMHIISQRNQELSGLNELIKARFVEMFGDPISNPKHWKMVELGTLTKVGSSKRIFEKEYVPEGVPFYRTKEIVELSKGNQISTELFITRERFDEIKRQYGAPKAGDLLISAVGTIGVIWIVDGKNDFYFKDGNLIRVDGSDKFDSLYMKSVLENLISEHKKQMSSGTAYAALTISGLSKMKVYDVPMDIQKKFATFVSQVDKSKAEVQKSLDETQILFDSLMQQYFG